MTKLIATFAVAVFALGACTGTEPILEDRSDQVKLVHRIPSK